MEQSSEKKPWTLIVLVVAASLIAAGAFAAKDESDYDTVDENGEAIWGNPNGIKSHRGVYFPTTEELPDDEMRVISCGTGMPTARESQAAACFLVELGNGDKFIFDLGTGSHARLASLDIPYDYLNKVFLSHLHSDHFGDFAALYIGGWVGGRIVPFKVWGPSGKDVVSGYLDTDEDGDGEPDFDLGLVNKECDPRLRIAGGCDYLYGTEYALEKWQDALTWDLASRSGTFPSLGGELEIHEFDFDGEEGPGAAYYDENGDPAFPIPATAIYEENGVTIRAWPAVHAIDGPVSFELEWNDFRFVFGGDTYPNKWFTTYAAGADLIVHECFLTPELLVKKYGFDQGQAITVGTTVHTSPAAFGYMLSQMVPPPKHAIAYHFFNDFDVTGDLYELIRKNYDGPLSMADDMMVWNVRRNDDTGETEIEVRLVVADEDVWPPEKSDESTSDTPSFPKSDWLSDGKWERPEEFGPDCTPPDCTPPESP